MGSGPQSDHYGDGSGTEPIDLIDDMDLGFYEGNIIKYVARWRAKSGVDDLRKAQWYLQRLIGHATLDDDVATRRRSSGTVSIYEPVPTPGSNPFGATQPGPDENGWYTGLPPETVMNVKKDERASYEFDSDYLACFMNDHDCYKRGCSVNGHYIDVEELKDVRWRPTSDRVSANMPTGWPVREATPTDELPEHKACR